MGPLTIILLLVGLVALVGGGELLVRGGSGLARAFGLSPLVVGLTVVSFATSAPELAVTLGATLDGNPGLAVGNVVGSNIANVLLVLGLSAVVLPLAVRSQLVRVDVPVMVVFSVLFLVLALDGGIGRVDGAVLLALLVAYTARSVVVSRRTAAEPGPAAGTVPEPRLPRDVALVVAGVTLLVLGARWLVSSATTIAASFGVSDLVIGLTVVAVGTSLPELATSVIAVARGERELAIGNVVGSNIFNIGTVLGLSATISPGGIPVDPGAVRFDLPVMLAVAVAMLPVVYTGASVARWEGLLFLAYYGAYVAYLVLNSGGHDAVAVLDRVMLLFVVPLTVLTLALLVRHEVRRRHAAGRSAVP